MRYNTIDQLDARIESIVKRNVKHYYTDWKNYDRPKYMRLKGSDRWIDKGLILIVRECGTYLYTLEEVAINEFARTVCSYYGENALYYSIDLNMLTINNYSFEHMTEFLRKTA